MPSALAMRPGVSVPVALPGVTVLIARVTALNVWSDVVAPGCTPDAPYALRRRSWSSQLMCGKKPLVADDPRAAQLRIEDALELRAERAVLISADGGREEQTIADAGLLLRVEAERLVRGLELVAAGEHGGLADVLRARRKP